MKKYTEEEKKMLLKSNCVVAIKDCKIIYSEEFKTHVLKEAKKGLFPMEIFVSSGFPVSLFRKDYPRNLVRKWKRSFEKEKYNNDSLKEDSLKSNFSRKSLDKISLDDARHLIAYLEEENDYLKKAIALEIELEKKKKNQKKN